jgi:hypothetical protein
MTRAQTFDWGRLRFPAEWDARARQLRVRLGQRGEDSIDVFTAGASRSEAVRRMQRRLSAAHAAPLVDKVYAGPPNANSLIRTRRSAIAGTGVFAGRDIPAGARIEDVTRPLVRYARVPKKGEPGYGHAIQVQRGWWLLLDHSRCYFLNHCCDANTRLEIDGVHVTVVAAKRIRRGQELTLDYGAVAFRDDPYLIQCTCGTPRCRGLVKGRRR